MRAACTELENWDCVIKLPCFGNPNLIRCATREAQKKKLRFCTDRKRSLAALKGVSIREIYATGKSRIYGKQRKSEEIKKAFRAAGS